MRRIDHAAAAIALFAVTASTALAFTPSNWIAERVERYVADSFGVSLDIDEWSVDLLSSTPGGSASGVSIGDGAGGTIVSKAYVSFEIDAGFLTGGALVFERLTLSNARIDLVVDEQGRGNWQDLLDAAGADGKDPAPAKEAGGFPAIRSLDIEDVELDYTDRALDRRASLTLSAGGSTTDPDDPLRFEARGDIDELPALLEAVVVPRGDPVAPSGSLGVDGRARVGDIELALEGEIGEPGAFDELDLTLSLSAPDGEDIEGIAARDLTGLGALALDGGIVRNEGVWRLREVVASVGDTRAEIDGALGDPTSARGLAPELSFSLSAPDGSDVAPLVAAFAGTELPPLPAFSASGGIATEAGGWLLRDVDARLGDIVLAASGPIGDPLGPDGFDPRIDFTIEAPDLRDVESIADTELPSLAPLALSGGLRRDGDDWVLRRFDGVVGSSTVGGDVRVDPSTTPPTLYANLIVRALYLDELLDALEGRSADEAGATVEASGQAPGEESGGWLPDEKLDLRPLTDAFDGAVRLRVREIVSTSLPLDSFAGRLEVDGDEIALAGLRIGVGGGTVSGGVDLDTAPAPIEGVVDLRARNIDLKKVASGLGLDDSSFGAIGGRAKYWLRGDSLASFAANADGGLFLLMQGGELDALLAELASIDALESLLLLLDPGKTLTDIDCGYLNLQTTRGVTEIEHFVLDTADTVFIADGRVDVADESFEIGFEPHPKDPSLFEINSGVRVSGSDGDLSVVPGVELVARVAGAAALAAVAAPAAALLAFIDTGGAEDSPYCDGLIDELDEAR